jgi:hypothetical protein
MRYNEVPDAFLKRLVGTSATPQAGNVCFAALIGSSILVTFMITFPRSTVSLAVLDLIRN